MAKRKSSEKRSTGRIVYAEARIDGVGTITARGHVANSGEHILPQSFSGRNAPATLTPEEHRETLLGRMAWGFIHKRLISDNPAVPPGAERLLGWVVRPDRLELILDDLEENFRKRLQRNGDLATAQEWYRRQVRQTFFHSLIAWAPRIAGFIYLLRKIGLF